VFVYKHIYFEGADNAIMELTNCSLNLNYHNQVTNASVKLLKNNKNFYNYRPMTKCKNCFRFSIESATHGLKYCFECSTLLNKCAGAREWCNTSVKVSDEHFCQKCLDYLDTKCERCGNYFETDSEQHGTARFCPDCGCFLCGKPGYSNELCRKCMRNR